MPSTMLTTTAPAPAQTTFRAIGSTVHVLATEPRAIERSEEVVRRYLAELDAAASRFRPDSEVSLLAERCRTGEASTFVSLVLADHLAAALYAARLTDGLVDPTVGRAVEASGYDADIARIRERTGFTLRDQGPPPGWRSVRLDESTRHLTVAAGTLLDLGASGKAHAADRIAAALAGELPGGFLVNLGGDLATSGPLPEGGWTIGVEDAHGRVLQAVLGTGQAFATSSTRHRVWVTSGGLVHHVIDPRTGRTAPAVWSQVTAAGATALEANAASTAALVLGLEAPEWLADRGIPARLDASDGTTVVTPGWPEGTGSRE